MGTTWAATQVRLRHVKAGLGGQDDGVSAGVEGVENASIPLWKRRRTVWSDYHTISDFRRFENENDSARQNHLNMSCWFLMLLSLVDMTSQLSAV